MRSRVALYLEIENCYYTCTFDRHPIDTRETVSLVDEDTMLRCAILGSTYTGESGDVQALTELLHDKNEKDGRRGLTSCHLATENGQALRSLLNSQTSPKVDALRSCNT